MTRIRIDPTKIGHIQRVYFLKKLSTFDSPNAKKHIDKQNKEEMDNFRLWLCQKLALLFGIHTWSALRRSDKTICHSRIPGAWLLGISGKIFFAIIRPIGELFSNSRVKYNDQNQNWSDKNRAHSKSLFSQETFYVWFPQCKKTYWQTKQRRNG